MFVKPSTIVVLVCGSRDWTDPEPISEMLRGLPTGALVVAGGQRGADRMATGHARSMGIHGADVPWLPQHFGKSAGPRRNAAMALLLPVVDVCHAFPLPGSRGTWDMVRRCESAGVPVKVWKPRADGAHDTRRA